MNEIQIFNHEEFGEIRTIEIDGQVYFVGVDVAKALNYARPAKAIIDHVAEEDVIKFGEIESVLKWDGRKIRKDTSIINESGLYSLILASKLQGAKKFKRWVTAEILPTIRKTGSYNPEPPKIEDKTSVYIENLNINIGKIGKNSKGNVDIKKGFIMKENELTERSVSIVRSFKNKRQIFQCRVIDYSYKSVKTYCPLTYFSVSVLMRTHWIKAVVEMYRL